MNNAIPPSLTMNPVYTQQRFPNGSEIQVQTGSHSQENTQNDTFATPKFPQAMSNSERKKQQSIEKILEVLTQKLRNLSNMDLALIFQHVVLAEKDREHEFFKGIFGLNEEPTGNTKVLSSEELQEELKERIQKDHRYAIETHFFVLNCLIEGMAHREIVSTAESIVSQSVSVANKYFQPLADRADPIGGNGRPDGLHGTLLMNRVQPNTFHNGSDLAHRALPERTFNANGIQFDGVPLRHMYDIQRGGCNEITSTIMSSPSSNSDAGSERTIAQASTRCSTQISHTEQEEEGGDSCKTKVTSSEQNNDSQIDGNPINEEQMREEANSSQESAIVDSVNQSGVLFHAIGKIMPANVVKPFCSEPRQNGGNSGENQEDFAPTNKNPARASSTLDCAPDGGSATLRNSENGKRKQDQTSSESEFARSISCDATKNDRVLYNESTRIVSHDNSDNLIEQQMEEPQENGSIEMLEKADEVRDFLNTPNSEKVDASVEKAVEGSSGSTGSSQQANLQEDEQVQEETTTTTTSGRPWRKKKQPKWVRRDLRDGAEIGIQNTTPIRKPTTRKGRRSRSTRARKTATDNRLEEEEEDENIVIEPVATTSQNQDRNGTSSESVSKTSTSLSENTDTPFVLNLNLYKSTTEETGANNSEEVTAVSSASTATKPKRKRYPRKKATEGCVSEKRIRSEPINHEDSQQTATIVNQNSSDPFDPRNQIQLPMMQYPEPTHQVGHTDPHHLPGDPFFNGGLVQQNSSSLHYQIPQYNNDFSQTSFNPGFQFNFGSNSEYRNDYQSQNDLYYTGNL